MKNLGLKRGGHRSLLLIALLLTAVLLIVLFGAGQFRREALANSELASLQYVADKTKNSHVHEILDMLSERGVVATPTETGIDIPSNVNDKDSIRIVPLVSSDEQYGFWKKNYFDVPDAASYEPVNRMLILRTYVSISPTFQGIILAHEGDHAFRNVKKAYWPKTKQEFCEQERNTHEFQYRLTAAIGGVEYEKLLETQVAVMYDVAKNTGTITGESFRDVFDQSESLAHIFGRSYSDFETDFRNTHLWMDTFFHFIDRYFDGDKERQKAAIICAFYDNLGIQTPPK